MLCKELDTPKSSTKELDPQGATVARAADKCRRYYVRCCHNSLQNCMFLLSPPNLTAVTPQKCFFKTLSLVCVRNRTKAVEYSP